MATQQDEKHALPGGGTRSERAPAYHLIPRAGIRRIAQRWGLGAEKHGAHNWKQSLTTEADAAKWCEEAYNHLIEHTLKMGAGVEKDDDHIGAIGWAATMFAYVEEQFGKPWTELTR